MTYPLSNPVTAGQPTAADHYNNLRKDALFLGNDAADSLALGSFFARHAENIQIEKLSATRVRIPYVTSGPAALVVNGYLLKATGNVDLPSGLISGSAALWYIFAQRSAGSTAFTLTANTTATEAPDSRIIGEVYFNGTSITYIQAYVGNQRKFPEPDYDSGWFAVSVGAVYTLAHNIGAIPSHVTLLWSASSAGTSVVSVHLVASQSPFSAYFDPIGLDATYITARTGSSTAVSSTCLYMGSPSASGYWRILAYK